MSKPRSGKVNIEKSSKKPASIRDVAHLAGVGVGTVSRFINDTGYVKNTTRERIRDAIEALNFVPNALAASLRGSASRTVGVIVPDISNPLYATIIKSLEQQLRAHKYTTILTSPGGDPDNELGIVESLLLRRVEAIILAPCQEECPLLEEALREANTPCVIMDRYLLSGVPGFSHIQTDHRTGMLLAIQNLVDTGHRNIFMPYFAGNRPGIERVKAFNDAIESNAAKGVAGVTSAGSQYTNFAAQATLKQLASVTPPDAIIVGHNQMLPRVLTALRDAALKAGRDISIISSDRPNVAEFHDPPIAGITRNLEAIGNTAFDLFQGLLESKIKTEERFVETVYERTMSVRTIVSSTPSPGE